VIEHGILLYSGLLTVRERYTSYTQDIFRQASLTETESVVWPATAAFKIKKSFVQNRSLCPFLFPNPPSLIMSDRLTRIAIVSSDKCKPKKCRQEW
jgi:hypothetical protein